MAANHAAVASGMCMYAVAAVGQAWSAKDHEEARSAALDLFRSEARGPCAQSFAETLRESCDELWEARGEKVRRGLSRDCSCGAYSPSPSEGTRL